MKIFKHTYIFLLVFSFIFTTTTSWVCSAAERDAPSSKGVKKAHGGAGRADDEGSDDDEETVEPRPRGVARAAPFRWVPNFNFVFHETPAVADEGGGLSSLELSIWHQAQAAQLSAAYALTSKVSRRNVARVMLSVIYQQDKHLRIRNVEIPHMFVSGCGMPGKLAGHVGFSPRCIQTLYGGIDAFRDPYFSDLQILFSVSASTSVSTYMPARADLITDDHAHSEREVLIYLRNEFSGAKTDGILARLLSHISAEKGDHILGLIINISSYRDMCVSCQDSLIQELTHRRLFLGDFVRGLQRLKLIDKHFKVIVAQSGMTEYAAGGTRKHSSFVKFTPEEVVDLARYPSCVLHMANPGGAAPAAEAEEGE